MIGYIEKGVRARRGRTAKSTIEQTIPQRGGHPLIILAHYVDGVGQPQRNIDRKLTRQPRMHIGYESALSLGRLHLRVIARIIVGKR